MNDLPNDDMDGMFTPKDLNKMTIDSFNEWKKLNNEQEQIVHDIMEKMEITPTGGM